jgi:putative cell wall-binding protein
LDSLAIAKTLKSAIIGGGQGVVSGETEIQLSSLSVKRCGGTDRYDTSKQLVNALYGTSIPFPAIATGANFPDTLAGAAIAGKAGGRFFR